MEKHPYEKEITAFLKSLSEADLFALANTVSQGLLKHKIYDVEGAITVILKYSADTVSILRRKCITREILFNYLDDNNVTVTLPTTKDTLIDKLLKFWEKNDTNDEITKQFKSEKAPVVQNIYNIHIAPQETIDKNKNEANELALKFSEWFYSIMNTDDMISTEHFYPDATLKLNLISNTITDSNNVESDPQQIVELLFSTKLKHGLFFNPNLSNQGVKGKLTPHGLVLVAACGSIHVGPQCVGIFEQLFGLAKDPFADNNWKIKYTELNLRNQSNVTALPLLERDALEGPEILEIKET